MKIESTSDLLTEQEIQRFGWADDTSTLHPYFKMSLIEPLLLQGSYAEHTEILSILARAGTFTALPVLSAVKDKIDSRKKGEWRVVQSGLAVIHIMIRQNTRHPCIPKIYLGFLNKNLGSKTKSLKYQAVVLILFACYVLKRELDTSGAEYIQRDIAKLASVVEIEKLKGAENLAEFVNTFGWESSCTSAGYRWEYQNAEWNRRIALEVLRAFWPDFSF